MVTNRPATREYEPGTKLDSKLGHRAIELVLAGDVATAQQEAERVADRRSLPC